MGRDKADIPWPGPESSTLAARTAALLASVCPVAVEVGPGHTALPRAIEGQPGAGPLPAAVAGFEHLAGGGWAGPVLLVATDLPRLTVGLLRWLAGHPGDGSVVPLSGGRVQPLCARYSPADMRVAARLVADGQRAMNRLLDAIDATLVPEELWSGPAGGADCIVDADTPRDLRRLSES